MLPHYIVIEEERKLIRVADRQNGRVQTFQMDGTPVSEVRPPDGVKTMYSMDVAGQLFRPFLVHFRLNNSRRHHVYASW